MPFCKGCKRSDVVFAINPARGVPRKQCVQCNIKSTAKRQKWKLTESGKASIAKTSANPVVIANIKEYRDGDQYKNRRKETNTARMQIPENRLRASEACSKWEKSEKGKKWRKDHRIEWLAWRRGYESDRHANDAAFRFTKNMRNRMQDSLKGKNCDHAHFFDVAIDFESSQALADYLLSLAALRGWTLDDYGLVWQVDHRIACFWYDTNNLEDRIRCWRAVNLIPMDRRENVQKLIQLPPDEELYEIGIENWPVDWKGVLPSIQERKLARSKWVRCVH